MVRILWRFSKTFDQKEKKNTDKNLGIWGFGYLGIWLWIDEIDRNYQITKSILDIFFGFGPKIFQKCQNELHSYLDILTFWLFSKILGPKPKKYQE